MPLPPSFPDLASLDLFASVVALGSLSKAARAHGITQPSASGRIKHLERQLGMRLLDRSPTGSNPTDAGRLVAGWTESILRAADELRIGVEALEAGTDGRLRIAASFTIAEYLLPAWLERYRRRHPAAPVELHVANSTEVLASLGAGTVEVGFIESPVPTPGLHSEVVGVDELVVVVASDHPLARRGQVTADQLVAMPLVLREPGSGTREAFDRALEAGGHPTAIVAFELGSTAAIKNAVAAGQLAGVLSRIAVTGDHEAGRLRIIDVVDLDLQRELRVVSPTTRTAPAAAGDLIALVTAAP